MAVAAELQAPAAWRRRLVKGRGRWLGIVVAVAFTATLLLPDIGVLAELRYAGLDIYQRVQPRKATSADVMIVEIDDQSLTELGQWPWPRDRLADLINRIAARQPKAIALDMLLTEPDRTSPEHVAEMVNARAPQLARQLEQLQSNDAILAASIARAPVITAAVGGFERTGTREPLGPSRLREPAPPLHDYGDALRTVPLIDKAATGHGFINVELERGIVRRMWLTARVEGAPALSLAAEAIRVADKAPYFTVGQREDGLATVRIGSRDIAAQPDGKIWIWFARRTDGRSIAASDVFAGRDNPASLRDKIVLIGVTATGLDERTTALGQLVPGVENHAQLIENIMEGTTLRRPDWTRFIEALLLACAAGVLIVYMPRAQPRRSFLIFLGCAAVVIGIGYSAFRYAHILIDSATPLAGLTVLYAVMLAGTLVAIDLQRRELAARLQLQRESAARAAGELEAARRIQTGILPTRETALLQERRVDIFTHMRPAREVGGDLYDFFLLPDGRFLVIQGDVSGKGLGAAMFMAVSKAVAKSCALREHAAVGDMMTTFNREIARENPEQMFVTMAALVMDLATGDIEYCNAGHEPPLVIRRAGEPLVLDDAGGPPLCVIDDYVYDQAKVTIEPRDVLALASDGITEAMNREGNVYGRDRLKALLQSPERQDLDLTVLGNEILASVKRFEGSAEPADDQTLVLVQWRGR